MAKNWAIAIGINQYEFLQPLNYAKRDAQLIQEFLHTEAGFDRIFFFSDDSPDVGGKSTRPYRANLLRVLRELFNNPFMEAGDNFWFFFSGHGMRYADRDYLMPSDGDPGDIENTAIPIHYVTERLRRCGADNVVLILDACRSIGTRAGEGMGRQTAKEAQSTGVISIFSCSPQEYSYEIETLQQGAFTHALLEGLGIQGQCATVERLNQYLNFRVPELVRQHKNARQTPYTIAEPVTKSHLILVPRYATLADIATLKNDAYRALVEKDLELAEQLWIRVLSAASGQDMEAVRALQKIAQLRVGSSETPSPSNSVNQDVGDKSLTFGGFAEPIGIESNLQTKSPTDDLSSMQGSNYTPLQQLLATAQEQEINEESFSQTHSVTSPEISSQAIDSSVSTSFSQLIGCFICLVVLGIVCAYVFTSSNWVLTSFFYIVITGILAAIALPSFLNQDQALKAKQSEAKSYMGVINRAQQAFYLEQSKFASTIEELELGIRSETKNYKYKIFIADKTKTLATATAQEDKLKSYTGAVFVIHIPDGYGTTITKICETIHPSRTPPEMPHLVGSEIQCAPGSFNPSNF
jgi:uncharacterized caspase-like protein/type II secretory pathway pseudopilin PulG